jgi:hypothetical protein
VWRPRPPPRSRLPRAVLAEAVEDLSCAAEPDVLVKELAKDTAIQAADTLLLTVPNQLGVDYNAHAIESILKYVAPDLGWR